MALPANATPRRRAPGTRIFPAVHAPEISYARSGDVHLAYQVVGDQPRDLLLAAGWLSHLETFWEEPGLVHIADRIASFSRFIWFDKRGIGMSDRTGGGAQPLEARIDDVRAVLDAAGSERATFVAIHEAGPMAMLYAATHPERIDSLVLYGTWPKGTCSDDYPWAPPVTYHERVAEAIKQRWGTGMSLRAMSPSRADDEQLREWYAKHERLGASPGTALEAAAVSAQTDVRDVLESISVPTLIVHRVGDRVADIGGARFMAERIPNATLVELEGSDHWIGTNSDQVLDVIQEFVTGAKPHHQPNRILTTILFTDLVRSTERVVQLGDAGWSSVLDRHDQVVAREVDRYRGVRVKHTGDGVLATFDGPARAIGCATAIRDAIQELGVEARAGLHTGEVELRGSDIAGIAVHTAARVMARAQPNEVLVSRTVTDLVAGSTIRFAARGEHELKGVPGRWQLYAVAD